LLVPQDCSSRFGNTGAPTRTTVTILVTVVRDNWHMGRLGNHTRRGRACLISQHLASRLVGFSMKQLGPLTILYSGESWTIVFSGESCTIGQPALPSCCVQGMQTFSNWTEVWGMECSAIGQTPPASSRQLVGRQLPLERILPVLPVHLAQRAPQEL
jgi:hypothetical protein